MRETAAPLISVILSVYNGERFLVKAVDSILSQSLGDFELILIDDASTDATARILDRYTDPRIVRLTNPQNIGLTRSLNTGLAAARGMFIARQDADDISHPDRLRRQAALLSAHPALGAVGTSYQVIDQEDRVLETVILPLSNQELQAALPRQNSFCHGSVMMRRACLEQVGGYREQFQYSQDYDLWLRLAEIGELANLADPLYQLRFGEESISRTRTARQLAYDRLARDLARQRRSSGEEETLDGEVIRAYSPEPAQWLHQIRRSAYLYYLSGRLPQAEGALLSAQRMLEQPDQPEAVSWAEWALSHAHQVTGWANHPEAGAKFICWAFDRLPLPDKAAQVRHTLGRFYADRAFRAQEEGRKREVLPNAFRAVSQDPAWLRSRGLWSISFAALWGTAGEDLRLKGQPREH